MNRRRRKDGFLMAEDPPGISVEFFTQQWKEANTFQGRFFYHQRKPTTALEDLGIHVYFNGSCLADLKTMENTLVVHERIGIMFLTREQQDHWMQ